MRCIFCWLFTLCCASNSTRAEDVPTASELAARHKAAADSLIPFQCKFRQTNLGDLSLVKSNVKTGIYARSIDAVRGRGKLGVLTFDELIKSGRRSFQMLNSQISREYCPGKIEAAKGNGVLCDAWTYALLDIADGERRPLWAWLNTSDRVKVSAVLREGHNLFRVDVPTHNATISIWFDPNVNYLARMAEVNTKSGAKTELIVSDFLEAGPGIFFPKSSRCSTAKSGDALSGWTAEFSQVSAGKPLPQSALDFRFPPDTIVIDEIAKTTRRTDASGRPVRPGNTRDGHPIVVDSTPEPSRSPDAPKTARPATQVEPTPRSRWLLVGGSTLVLLSGVVWLVRRVKRCESA